MDKESTKHSHSGDADSPIVKSSAVSADQPCQPNLSSNSDTLDLGKKKLCSLNEDLYRNHPSIKNLHLEGNVLCSLPESLFVYLPNLVWLDLRYNKITSLPSTIGKQRQLKYLLLEANPIQALPVQLGDLTTLKALNLRHCPLEFPPEDVVCKGLESILSFLRNCRETDPVCSEFGEPELPPVEKLNLKELIVIKIFHGEILNREILNDWQKQTQIMQHQKAKNRKRIEVQQEVPIAVPPYAIDLDPSLNKNDWEKQKPFGVKTDEMMPRIMSVKSLQETEKARASRDHRLEQRIREHIQSMQERKRNPKHSAQEEMEAARKDLEMTPKSKCAASGNVTQHVIDLGCSE
ncbi:leucine-rich repeat-containing protein 27 [Pyxicephalus adspersus]|uniref:leucine-rich repeat-containing protein 27 n=1 Tax=Pyxicephalus adspersus TaxID=30357 RepID=UPI003B5CCD7C